MLASRSLFRLDRVLKFTTTYAALEPVNYFLGHRGYCGLRYNIKMGGGKDKQSGGDRNKKIRTTNAVWRPVSTQATSNEECSVRVTTDELESDTRVQEVHRCTSTRISSAHNVIEVAATNFTASSSALQDNGEKTVFREESVVSTEKHSISVEVGASLVRFIRGKGGSTQREIEDEMGVKIIIPSSKEEDSVIIEGISMESISRASEKIHTIIDEAVKSQNLDYSHFISLPLAIHPELVDKLVNFQNSILGISDSCVDEKLNSDSNEDTSENEGEDQKLEKGTDVAVELNVEGDSEQVKVNLTNIPLVSYAPKMSRASTLSGTEILLFLEVITDAYTKAGLVLEKDANQKLKLHATVMNARHRKRKNRTRKVQSFDARGIFKQYGSEEWGEYLIREAHLSQRFVFDDNGYYHCCASIPFPETYE
ncbi:activating signal cointegrator 1 complex subunit 1 [Prunus avium]|uniref:Activating signal cointegrator 1 complex subunit 1 n=1 Tax=Prunus avium TaxID=42229 RepID=A0A6P5TPZ7_PRUAV|nr:activating signal cointegrator 1 complex subunit 1 [Prunus avium]